MKKIKTKVKTNIAIGVALISGAVLMAAAAASAFTLSGTLTVDVSSVVTSSTIVRGWSSNFLSVNLAATGGPVTVKSLEFDFIADDDGNFRIINDDVPVASHVGLCRLRNSAGTVVKTVAPSSGGQLLFNGLTISIPRGATFSYVVDCDFMTVGTMGSDDDVYALTISGEKQVIAFSGRTKLSGGNLNIGDTSDSGVNIGGGIYLLVKDHGDVVVSLDSTSPTSGVVVPGMRKTVAGIWRLEPEGEDYTLNTISFSNSGEDSVATQLELSCLDGSGTLVTFNQTLSSGLVEFNGLTCFLSELGGSLVTVSFDSTLPLDTTGSGHPASGDELSLSFDAVSGNFAATGQKSGFVLTGTSGSDLIPRFVPANSFKIHQTYPGFSLSSGSPSGTSILGMNEVFSFWVEANYSGDVGLTQTIFKITSTDNAISGWNRCASSGLAQAGNFALYDTSDLTNPVDFSTVNIDFLTEDGTSCFGTDLSDHLAYVVIGSRTSPEENIPAGLSKEFVLYMDTSGASAINDDVLTVSIPSDDEVAMIGQTSVRWTDGLGDWGGNSVLGLPLAGGVLIY